MRTVFSAAVLALMLSVSALAQTNYQQSTPALCNANSTICNGQQLDNGAGDYVFNGTEDTTTVTIIGQFASNGTISWTVGLPPLVVGNSGNFAYTYTLNDGHTGGVSGSVKVVSVCTVMFHGQCIKHGPDYEVMSSTLTVN